MTPLCVSPPKSSSPNTYKLVSLSNENADDPDVMNSKRKFDVLLYGTLLYHITYLNAFVLTPAVQICSVRAQKERKYQLPVSNFDIRDVNVLVA